MVNDLCSVLVECFAALRAVNCTLVGFFNGTRCYASTDSVIKMKTNDNGNGSLEKITRNSLLTLEV